MYHVELRQFPHNFCRFNLTERELREAILDSWAQGEWIDFGERKWNPHQAQLTVLEGPQLPLEQLSMGRGWRAAAREGRDVTEQLLAAVRADTDSSRAADGRDRSSAGAEAGRNATDWKGTFDTAAAGPAGPDMRLLADSLSLEVLAKLSGEPAPLTIVWQLARERHPEWPASDSLKLAEHAVRSLTGSRLAVVLVGDHGAERVSCTQEEQIDAALREIDNWSNAASSASASIRRA
ncbi:MAG TPA: hypothetical protein VIJ39_07345 [Solirubrobacteraceae bacterium]